jgi:hypothetical protein
MGLQHHRGKLLRVALGRACGAMDRAIWKAKVARWLHAMRTRLSLRRRQLQRILLRVCNGTASYSPGRVKTGVKTRFPFLFPYHSPSRPLPGGGFFLPPTLQGSPAFLLCGSGGPPLGGRTRRGSHLRKKLATRRAALAPVSFVLIGAALQRLPRLFSFAPPAPAMRGWGCGGRSLQDLSFTLCATTYCPPLPTPPNSLFDPSVVNCGPLARYGRASPLAGRRGRFSLSLLL